MFDHFQMGEKRGMLMKRVAIGSDHAGYEMKTFLFHELARRGFEGGRHKRRIDLIAEYERSSR